MYSFVLSIIALILGYFLYGKFVEKVFKPDPARIPPSIAQKDGVDYVPMPAWKVYMIQFLNIAGTGPVFGAIMGAMFGPSSYLWIVFGAIFGGAVHDYFSGMLSMRNGGAGLPDLAGKYMGKGMKTFVLAFSIIVLLLVGTVFVYSPAILLSQIAGDGSRMYVMIWIVVIFIYYLIATMLPVDKVIGKIYPLFALSLLFMALGLMVCLFVKWPTIPEFWNGLGNLGEQQGLMSGQGIFPCLFITIACGAVSGFHATQSPMMARCATNEKLGRPVFYGAMITEGVVALIWAAVSSWFFFGGGAETVGLNLSASAPRIVVAVSMSWLGIMGGILAVIGVVAAPITSGDTAFRSARMIIADFLHLDQKPILNRLYVSLALFVVASLLLWFNIADENGFNVIWRYFGWANQTLAAVMLWIATVYLVKDRRNCAYLMTLLPASFMTSVCLTYLCVAKIGFNMPQNWSLPIGAGVFVLCIVVFFICKTVSESSKVQK